MPPYEIKSFGSLVLDFARNRNPVKPNPIKYQTQSNVALDLALVRSETSDEATYASRSEVQYAPVDMHKCKERHRCRRADMAGCSELVVQQRQRQKHNECQPTVKANERTKNFLWRGESG